MERLKIAITGASGFIGSNIFKYICKTHEVYALSHSTKSWRLDERELIYLDITNREKCKIIMDKLKPDIVIHCAAYGINYNEKDPKKIIETNVIGTLNLLNSCTNVPMFINTGSCFEYGIQNKPIRENMNIAPETTYGMSKALSTNMLQSFSKIKSVTLRLFTVYGYHEAKYRLVPYLLYSSLSKTPAKLSNKHNVRDFVFIEDVVRAYEIILKKYNKIENMAIFNVGSGKQTSLNEIATMTGAQVKWEQSVRPKEPKRIWQADIQKIKKELGWSPKYSLEKGIEKTREWMEHNIELYKT